MPAWLAVTLFVVICAPICWVCYLINRSIQDSLTKMEQRDRDRARVRAGLCTYPHCDNRIGNDWDDRCVEHSYRSDGGRP